MTCMSKLEREKTALEDERARDMSFACIAMAVGSA